MPRRIVPYITSRALTEPSAECKPKLAPATAAELALSKYHIAPAWVDTAGRTRTWTLRNPHGIQMAEITTKSAALKLAALLNNVVGDERDPAR